MKEQIKQLFDEYEVNDTPFFELEKQVLGLFSVSNQRELLIAYNEHILSKLTEYRGEEICDKTADDFLSNL